MIALAALALAGIPVDVAERAFAMAAQRDGQWTAFRAFAAPDAIMVTDHRVLAADALKGKADPPVAVRWSPAATITSCDGTLAFSVGPWTRPGNTGSFATVWRHDAADWRWIYDDGEAGTVLPSKPKVDAQRAACGNHGVRLHPLAAPAVPGTHEEGWTIYAPFPVVAKGESRDRSLRWIVSDAGKGGHYLTGEAWDGRRYQLVLTRRYKP